MYDQLSTAHYEAKGEDAKNCQKPQVLHLAASLSLLLLAFGLCPDGSSEAETERWCLSWNEAPGWSFAKRTVEEWVFLENESTQGIILSSQERIGIWFFLLGWVVLSCLGMRQMRAFVWTERIRDLLCGAWPWQNRLLAGHFDLSNFQWHRWWLYAWNLGGGFLKVLIFGNIFTPRNLVKMKPSWLEDVFSFGVGSTTNQAPGLEHWILIIHPSFLVETMMCSSCFESSTYPLGHLGRFDKRSSGKRSAPVFVEIGALNLGEKHRRKRI